MQTQQHCSTPDQLLTFLRGQLSVQEEAELQLHLNDCVLCRERMESTAADASHWNEAKQFFASGTLQRSSEDSTSDQAEESQGSQRIRQTLDTLGPTDDPESLGRIGGYEVTGVVGAGGMGVVLKAHDRSLDRIVAIKVMSPHLASSGSARKRFAREAKAAAAVLHPNVISIHSVNSEDGNPYLVMPYVRGASLQKRIDSQGPLPLKDTLRIGTQIAAGLAAAHEQGLVHRDIKPANILLEEGVERVTITDFGLARAVDDASMTCSGVIAGTPQYMSPEQTRGEPTDARSDLFSLGSVLYAMCAGRPPFRAETTYGVLHRIANDHPTPVCEINSDVPRWLGYVIERLMAKRAEDRFESASQVAELLEGCLAHVQQPTAMPLPQAVLALATKNARRPPIGKFVAAAAAAFAFFFSGIFIVLELNKGTLTIESEMEDVPIRILKGEEIMDRLTVTKSGNSIRVAAGDYVVELDAQLDGMVVENDQVSLNRGETEHVKIRLLTKNANATAGRSNPSAMENTESSAVLDLHADAKIIVDLYGGKDVLGQMNTSGPNKAQYVKLVQSLNAIEGVQVNFRQSGPGNAIAMAVVRDPTKRTGQPSKVHSAISNALKDLPNVRWEAGSNSADIGRSVGIEEVVTPAPQWEIAPVDSELAANAVQRVMQYMSAVRENDTEAIKSIAKGLRRHPQRDKDIEALLQESGVPKPYKTLFVNHSAVVALGPITSSDDNLQGRFLIFTLSLVDERWSIVDIDLEEEKTLFKRFRSSPLRGKDVPHQTANENPSGIDPNALHSQLLHDEERKPRDSSPGEDGAAVSSDLLRHELLLQAGETMETSLGTRQAPVPSNAFDAKTLDDVTSIYNERTRQLRTELFNPPIPDLTTEQMRAAMLDAAEQYRKQGRVEIASALKTSAESNRLSDRLTFMGMTGTMSDGFRQVTPQLNFEVASNALHMVFLGKAELRYSLKGWSSKTWGDIHPPITGKWDLVSVEQRGESLTQDAYNEWRQKHASWTELTIDENSLTMAGDNATKFDFSVDYDSALPQYTISQDGETKFSGVLMGNGFVDDTTLDVAIDIEGTSKPKTFHTKDRETTKLTYLRN
jgi:serine/threonine protein kinase